MAVSDAPHCPACAEACEWQFCHKCNGDGGYWTICPICDGDGGYWQCANHHNADPIYAIEWEINDVK